MTDIARDEKRSKAITDYLNMVKNYIKDPTKENLNKAFKAAKYADSVPNGFWCQQTSLAKGAKRKLENLLFWVKCGIAEVKGSRKAK